MDITQIAHVNNTGNQGPIRAHVCRTWKNKTSFTSQSVTSFDVILVDEQGSAIHATMDAKDVAHFSSILEVGKVYNISGYYTQCNKTSNIVIPHECMLRLTRRSAKITEFTGNTSRFPKHHFHLVEYNLLITRKGLNYPYLSDILGRVKVINALDSKICADNRVEDRRTIEIENIRRDELSVTLWGDIARLFDQQRASELNGPCIMIFTSTRIKEFRNTISANSTSCTVMFMNPEILEAEYYYQMFAGPDFAPQIKDSAITGISNAQQLAQQEKTTLKQFHKMNPDANRNIKFAAEARIISIAFQDSWFYYGCPVCTATLKAANGTECSKHGKPPAGPIPWYKFGCIVEDETEEHTFMLIGKSASTVLKISAEILVNDRKRIPNIVPPEIHELIGKTFLFQVHWGAPKTDMTRSDLLIAAAHNITTISHQAQLQEPSSNTSSIENQYKRKFTQSELSETSTQPSSESIREIDYQPQKLLKIRSPSHE